MEKGLIKTVEEISVVSQGMLKCDKAYNTASSVAKECIEESLKSYMERYKTLVLNDYLKHCDEYSNLYGKPKPGKFTKILDMHICNGDLPCDMLEFLLELKSVKTKYYSNYKNENLKGLLEFYRSNNDSFRRLTKWIINAHKESSERSTRMSLF